MSRYPTLGPRGQAPEMRTTYDQSLLAGAPAITKSDRQQGYNIDILERQPVSAVASGSAGYGGRPRINLDDITTYNYSSNNSRATLDAPAALPPLEKTPSYEVNPLSSTPPPRNTPYYGRRTPWWRTRKGMIILGVAVVLVLGITIGVVAGVVSQKNKSKSSNSSSPLNGVDLSPVASTTSTRTSGPTPTVTPKLSTIAAVPEIRPTPIVADPTDGQEPITNPSPNLPSNGGNAPPSSGATTKPTICATFPNIPACRD